MKTICKPYLFSLIWIFRYDFIVYAYFIYAVTASTVTDDVTKLVMPRIFNTNLQYSGTSLPHILNK